MHQSRRIACLALFALTPVCGAWTGRSEAAARGASLGADLYLVEAAVAAEVGSDVERDCGDDRRGTQSRACLLIVNETSCPVEVWIDGELLYVCEPFMKYRVWSRRLGEVTLAGRSRCDTWGPVTRTLSAGRVSVWRISDLERQ